jgi:hypothetical protein
MALQKCKECGEKVSTQAKICPHCAAKAPRPTSAVTWLVAMFILLIVVVGIFSDTDQPGISPQEIDQPNTAAANIPAHIVASNTSLAPKDGRRIELHSANPELTEAECSILINQYSDTAGPEGQVSVRKPNTQDDLAPWCIENFDGKGIVFNERLF